MAAHILNLGGPFERPLGMSAAVSFDGHALAVRWKGEQRSFPAQQGQRVMVSCDGEFPCVTFMKPPADATAQVAWRYRFFASKRYRSREELVAAAKEKTWYSAPHGYSLPACSVFEAPHCVVVYKAAMEGQIGVPWGWWADDACQPADLRELIARALGMPAQVYTVG